MVKKFYIEGYALGQGGVLFCSQQRGVDLLVDLHLLLFFTAAYTETNTQAHMDQCEDSALLV